MPPPSRATALLASARRPVPPHHLPADTPTEPLGLAGGVDHPGHSVFPDATTARSGDGVDGEVAGGGGDARDDALGSSSRSPTLPTARPTDAELPSGALVRRRDAVVRLPSSLAGARVSPSWAAIGGAALVVVLALASIVLAFGSADDASEPVPTTPQPALATGAVPGAGGTPGATADAAAPATAAPAGDGTSGAVAPTQAAPPAGAPELYVHVVGEVARPQVVTLPAGSRVGDALEAAGGPTKDAVLSGINLARVLVDGEQVVVPDAENAPLPIATASPPVPVTPAAPGAPGTAATPGAAPAQVDLNTADQATLETLPGVGPVLAGRILQWRTENGRFTSVDELSEVSGVGEKTLESLRPLVRV